MLISVTTNLAESPPPTRGTLTKYALISSTLGITPAYAGNTELPTGKTNRKPNHPRLRGEHIKKACKSLYSVESPPPTRGTPPIRTKKVAFTRITPAYAGNTQFAESVEDKKKNHPRLRGEHFLD